VPYTVLPPKHPAPQPLFQDFPHTDCLAEEGWETGNPNHSEPTGNDDSVWPPSHNSPPVTIPDDDSNNGDNVHDPDDDNTDDDSNSRRDVLPPPPPQNDSDSDDSDSDDDEPEPTEEDFSPPVAPASPAKRSQRSRKLPWKLTYANAVSSIASCSNQNLPAAFFSEVMNVIAETMPPQIGESGSGTGLFIPEPQGLYRVLREPPAVKAAWIKAFVSKLTGLVFTQQAVAISPASESDSVVPVREIFKCKLNAFGAVDKLKCRIVFVRSQG
jgi:hypothetical protein